MTLLRSGVTVTEACMAVGCSSLGSFSSRFKQAAKDRDYRRIRKLVEEFREHRTVLD